MKDLHDRSPQHQSCTAPALVEEGLDVRGQVQPGRRRKNLEISVDCNINPFADPLWHLVLLQVSPEIKEPNSQFGSDLSQNGVRF